MPEKKKRKVRFDISVWVVISAVAVLAVILGMMLLMQFQQAQNQARILLIEKGTTLIHSFESGLRLLPEQMEEGFYLQKLLMETAQQPDVDYLMVTDGEGHILADSDPSMLGLSYGLDLDVKKIAQSREIFWRQTANPQGAGTFEVYRGLSPAARNAGKEGLIVYVGFNMAKIEKASREDALRTAVTALVLVLIGSLAIVSLFLVQAYRLARVSLSRVTVFSEALVKNMPIALLAVDREGKIAACNDQAKGLLTGSPAEAVGREASRVLPEPFLRLLEVVQGRTGPVEEDILWASETGEQTWEVVAAAFADDEDQEGRILLARNVTGVRQMEKEVARSRHLNAIASLAAGVAHEIRNPLSSIKGFAVYFKKRLAGNREDEETAEIMIAETERLNRVISQLIEFARPLVLKREPANLEDLVRQTVRLVTAEAEQNGVAVEIRAGKGLPRADVDPDKVRQVLLNIFLNALAAMPGGGRLSILLNRREEFVEVEVSDTGEGIPRESLPRIYDPYFTSKPAGTGLGLAVAQKIMDAHGGAIQVESREGAGTRVSLRFPLMEKEGMEE
jgi:two-component system sensor histidine kinase HydH